MLTAAKLLLTLLTLGYSAATALADFNKTHATNPLWTGHARFHVVWQVLSYNLIGLLMLVLLWAPGPSEVARVWLVWAVAACVYASFFMTLGTMHLLVMFGIAKSDGMLDSLISRRVRDVTIKELPMGTKPYVVGIFTDKELTNALGYDIYLPRDEWERVKACLRPRSVTRTRWT